MPAFTRSSDGGEARQALIEAAHQVLAGGIQPGQENIHPEWQRWLRAIATQLTENGPELFKRLPVFAHTMFIGDYDDTARQFNHLRCRSDWETRWKPALVESSIGGAWPSELYPPSSGNQIRQAYVLARFEEEMHSQIDQFDQIIEFGGGFGALCLLAHRLGFQGRYVLVDNQPVRALQRWYLIENGVTVEPDGEALPESKTCFVPNTDLDPVLSTTYAGRTAFIANWSLSEVAISVRDRVLNSLRRAQVDAIWITYQKMFEVNNGAYFASKIQDFLAIYDVSIRSFRVDANPQDYYYGHACFALRRIEGRSFSPAVLSLEPAPFETSDMRETSFQELEEEIRAAITAKRAFSALRLGDGEARIIGYPRYISNPEVADIWQTWFGVPEFQEDDVNRVRLALQAACLQADVIGVPKAPADIESEFGRVKALLPREGFVSSTTPLCHAGFHLGFHREGRYSRLLAGVPTVGVIGPRDVRDALSRSYGVDEVIWLSVPPEMKFSALDRDQKAALIGNQYHLRHRFDELMDEVIPSALRATPGMLVLVGAGVLGKIYCGRIKQLGGVALDVGSMMDVWAGLKTRDNHRFEGLRPVFE